MNIYFVGMCISMLIYIIVGIVISCKVKDANEFYVAGRRAPTLLIVGSMIASYVGTGLFMGDAAEFYAGLFASLTILATMQIVGYLWGATFFGRYLRRSEVLTVPEFFGKRFCSEKIKKLAIVTSIVTMLVYMLSTMQGIGTLMNVVTGVDYNLCIALALVAFTVVAASSGSKGVLITDTIMFGVFTLAIIVGAIVIIHKAGGWNAAVYRIVNETGIDGLLSWHGNPDHLYRDGWKNIIWGIEYGIVWTGVCMVGPWQSSRYLMAKDEHTVIRSSIFSAFGVFLLEFVIGMASVALNLFDPQIESDSQVMIWAAMNILPKALGVLLLSGVLAAGISSATTFLSLIGASVANDIMKGGKKSILIGRVAMIITSMIILFLAIFNPPQIFWIMYFGGSIIASSWMPVALASIISKRVTKTGAFCGMLFGFISCFFIKMYSFLMDVTLPLYLDATMVGIVANILGLIVGSLLTHVSDEEKEKRNMLLRTPEKEKNPQEVIKTLGYLKISILLGVVISLVLIVYWVIPYTKSL